MTAISVENTCVGTRTADHVRMTLTITDADYLVAIHSHRDNRTPVSAHWDYLGLKESMELLKTYIVGGNRVTMWGLANPTPGAGKQIRCYCSGDACNVGGAVGLEDAGAAEVVAEGTSAGDNIVIDGAENGISIAGSVQEGTDGWASEGGTTIHSDSDSDAVYENVAGGGNYILGSGSHTLGFKCATKNEYHVAITLQVDVSTPQAVVGVLTMAGVLSLKINKSLSGAMTPSGVLGKKSTMSLSGAVSFVGSAIKKVTQSLAGSVSFSGVVSKKVKKVLSGAVSFVGSIIRDIATWLSAIVYFVGAPVAQVLAKTAPAGDVTAVDAPAESVLLDITPDTEVQFDDSPSAHILEDN